MDREGWEAYWQSPDRANDSSPDPILLEEIRSLRPGRAIDFGAGDGSASIALARLGWQVTAVDFSTTALQRLQERIADDPATSRAIDIGMEDIIESLPGTGYDLAYLGYIHVRPDQRLSLFANATHALADGGLLLYNGFTYEGSPKKENHRQDFVHRYHFVDLFAPLSEIVRCSLAVGLVIEYADQRLRPAPPECGKPNEKYMSVVMRARKPHHHAKRHQGQ